MTLHSLGSHHPPKQVPDTQLQYNCFHGSVYLKYFITEKSAAWKIESSREKNLSAIQLWLFDLTLWGEYNKYELSQLFLCRASPWDLYL